MMRDLFDNFCGVFLDFFTFALAVISAYAAVAGLVLLVFWLVRFTIWRFVH